MISRVALCLLVWVGVVPVVQAIPIDNAVVTPPEITCHPDSIEINIATRNPFEGHLYVKNKFTNENCRYSAERNSADRFANIRLPFGDECLVDRRRSLNPKGIFSDVTVIMSFHPSFLTKVDQAYTIQCFYMEADKTVDTDIEVSMITTGFQTQFVPMPICRYDVLDAPDGNPVEFALIGESVYHQWNCDTETVDTFCMKVYGCFVNDFGEDQFQLLDDEGCAQDRYIMNNLEYPTDLMAVVETHVFKFTDRPSLYFNCQIQIDVKEPNGDCSVQTQPACDEPEGAGDGNRRRNKRQPKGSEAVMDVTALLDTLDIEDHPVNSDQLHHRRQTLNGGQDHSAKTTPSICISSTSLFLISAFLGILSFICTTLVCLWLRRNNI